MSGGSGICTGFHSECGLANDNAINSQSPDNVRVIRAANPVCQRTTERGKVINPEYSIFRDQPIAGASPLRINTLLCRVVGRIVNNHELRFRIQEFFKVGNDMIDLGDLDGLKADTNIC